MTLSRIFKDSETTTVIILYEQKQHKIINKCGVTKNIYVNVEQRIRNVLCFLSKDFS